MSDVPAFAHPHNQALAYWRQRRDDALHRSAQEWRLCCAVVLAIEQQVCLIEAVRVCVEDDAALRRKL